MGCGQVDKRPAERAMPLANTIPDMLTNSNCAGTWQLRTGRHCTPRRPTSILYCFFMPLILNTT